MKLGIEVLLVLGNLVVEILDRLDAPQWNGGGGGGGLILILSIAVESRVHLSIVRFTRIAVNTDEGGLVLRLDLQGA